MKDNNTMNIIRFWHNMNNDSDYSDDSDDSDEVFEANDEIIDDDNISDFCSACGSKLYENRYGYLVCPRCDDTGNDAA